MSLTLKRFGQEVDLENPEIVHYFLVFDKGGREVRLPVQKETTEALAVALYGENSAPLVSKEEQPYVDKDPGPPDQVDEAATEFGGNENDDEPHPSTDDMYADADDDDGDGVPGL